MKRSFSRRELNERCVTLAEDTMKTKKKRGEATFQAWLQCGDHARIKGIASVGT